MYTEDYEKRQCESLEALIDNGKRTFGDMTQGELQPLANYAGSEHNQAAAKSYLYKIEDE